MKRSTKEFLKRQIFTIYKLGTILGVHILPVHYYSPIPDIVKLRHTKHIWAKKSKLPGLKIDIEQQVSNLKKICKPYQYEYKENKFYLNAVNSTIGPGYGYVEAQALHAVVRYFKPKRIIEIGCGVSTLCMLNALGMNEKENDNAFAITCIDPYPTKKLKELRKVKLIKEPVQKVPFEPNFTKLDNNDILFIDSSHTVKPGSDVNYLVLEILPKLNAGVIIHFHDIYLPYDYSPAVLQTVFHWMETSLIRAFLINNNRAKIIFSLSHLHHDRKEIMKKVFPEYNSQKITHGIRDKSYKPFHNPINEHFPSSLYIQIL